jgi:hypothetical protein
MAVKRINKFKYQPMNQLEMKIQTKDTNLFSNTPPIIPSHIPQSGINPPLSRHRMTPRGEQFTNARGFKPRLAQSHGGA